MKRSKPSWSHRVHNVLFHGLIHHRAVTMAPVHLAAILGGTAVAWVGTIAINHPVAQAYVARQSVSLAIGQNETFASLVRRAEAASRAAAQRNFDADLLVSEVSITVIGERAGRAAPVLKLQVTRPQWRNRPNPQLWGTYFRSARTLLGFTRPNPEPEAAPPVTPAEPAASPNSPPASAPPATSPPLPVLDGAETGPEDQSDPEPVDLL